MLKKIIKIWVKNAKKVYDYFLKMVIICKIKININHSLAAGSELPSLRKRSEKIIIASNILESNL